MSLELVVDARPNGIWLALLRDGKLIELQEEKGNTEFAVGDIYLGKIKKIVPGLNAAFVDVGYEKDAFLHYLDLGPQANSLFKYVDAVRSGKQNVSNLMYFKNEGDINKDGKINEAVKSGQYVAVRRDTGEKITFNKTDFVKDIKNLLDNIQSSLFAK